MYLSAIYFLNVRKGVIEFSAQTLQEGNEALLRHGLLYNLGPIRALDSVLTKVDSGFEYTYFRLYLGGLEEFLITFLNFFGSKIEYANAMVGERLHEEIYIGRTETFNALYTNVFYMYADFDLLGVIVYSFFNGYIFSLFFKRFYNSPSLISIVIFVFFLVVLLFTPMNWGVSSPSSWIFVAICLYCSKYINNPKYG
jgi:oligosaccharide repeat unit polymerase